MPLIEIHQLNKSCSWGVWHIQESQQDLMKWLDTDPEDLAFLEEIPHPEKKIESLAARLMLKELLRSWGLPYPGVFKNDCDKPILRDYNFPISLSHAKDYAIAIIHREKEVGIDMEQVRQKIKRVSHKFLSARELDGCAGNLDKMTVLWVVKEAIYKLYGKKKISLIQNIKTQAFELAEKGLVGVTLVHPERGPQPYQVSYQQFGDYFIAYSF